jgi:hypothetical protein
LADLIATANQFLLDSMKLLAEERLAASITSRSVMSLLELADTFEVDHC